MTEPEDTKSHNTAILSETPQSALGVFLSWLRDLGGSYEILHVERTAPKYPKKPLPLYKLDPRKYYYKPDGSVRRISEKGQIIAEKLGI